VLIIFILAIIATHYLEPYQTEIVKKVRNLVYYGQFSRFNQEKDSMTTNYKFADKPMVNPVHNAQKALLDAEAHLIAKYFENKKVYLVQEDHSIDEKNILKIADWFIGFYKPETINGVEVVRLPYNFDYPSYDLKAPWYSGMAQGLALVVQMAAYDLTKDEKYLNFGRLLGNMYDIKVKDGGVKVEVEGGYWYEEYADQTMEESKYPLVLNGHNFALDGMFWLEQFDSENKKWKELLNKGILAVEGNIQKYDAYFWSYYGLWHNYAHYGYHQIHIDQLDRLSKFYGEVEKLKLPIIDEYKKKFEFYQVIPLAMFERLFFMHNNMILVLISMNFVILSCLYLFYRKVVKKENI
jgi:hypothetical protein